MSIPVFFKMVSEEPDANHMLELYARQFNEDMLKDLYYQDDRKADSAMLHFQQSFQQKVFSESEGHPNFCRI